MLGDKVLAWVAQDTPKEVEGGTDACKARRRESNAHTQRKKRPNSAVVCFPMRVSLLGVLGFDGKQCSSCRACFFFLSVSFSASTFPFPFCFSLRVVVVAAALFTSEGGRGEGGLSSSLFSDCVVLAVQYEHARRAKEYEVEQKKK